MAVLTLEKETSLHYLMLDSLLKHQATQSPFSLILAESEMLDETDLQNLSDCLVEQDTALTFQFFYDPSIKVLAILFDAQTLQDTHYFSLFVRDFLISNSFLYGNLWVGSYPQSNSDVKNLLQNMLEHLLKKQKTFRNVFVISKENMNEHQKKLLFVDENEVLISFLKHRYEMKGFEIFIAKDGYEAIQLFDLHKPDLVITELNVPGIDGFTILHYIKQISDSPTEVFILTSRKVEGDLEKCFTMGAVDFMTKPFSPSELDTRIEKAIMKRVTV